MVRITVELVRKRAEHHDRQMAPLEEIALHQENIEKLEHLQDWCPKLQILLLQSNLIAKIENLNKLKHLSYLNLALNNIEVIENLERCESLRKLDLTLNFIGEITSVESLVDNYNLEILYLTGNPCADFKHYRDYVVASLPQLTHLDGVEVERSDRIRALQALTQIRGDIHYEQADYRCKRKNQKARLEQEIEDKWNRLGPLDEDERNKQYWQEKCEHAPEVRLEMERYKSLKLQGLETETNSEEKKERKLFAPDGRPFNINQPKIAFHFDSNDPNHFLLDVEVYKYMDTSLVDVDIQPNYVRVTLKGKIFQLCLPEEVVTMQSTAQRSKTTGHLVLTMPKVNPVIKKKTFSPDDENEKKDLPIEHTAENCVAYKGQSRREFLEIGPDPVPVLDFTKMTRSHAKPKFQNPRFLAGVVKAPSKDFVDDPEVPDLE